MAKVSITMPPKEADIRAAVAKALQACSIQAVSLITRRTAAGLDEARKPFRPYSKRYAEQRRGSGRQADHVDLTRTGAMLRNLKFKRIRMDGQKPVGVIGFEGQHTRDRFARHAKAWATDIHSSNPVRTRRLKDGRVVTYRQEVDRYRRIAGAGGRRLKNGDRASWVLQISAERMPMAQLVTALDDRYHFFGVENAEDKRALVATFQRVLTAELRRLTR